jgi:prevent-host-death family protein
MKQVNVAEAKAQLSELIEAAVRGEEVVIARRNIPVVRLTVVESARVVPRAGKLKGLVWTSPDFDEPLGPFGEPGS